MAYLSSLKNRAKLLASYSPVSPSRVHRAPGTSPYHLVPKHLWATWPRPEQSYSYLLPEACSSNDNARDKRSVLRPNPATFFALYMTMKYGGGEGGGGGRGGGGGGGGEGGGGEGGGGGGEGGGGEGGVAFSLFSPITFLMIPTGKIASVYLLLGIEDTFWHMWHHLDAVTWHMSWRQQSMTIWRKHRCFTIVRLSRYLSKYLWYGNEVGVVSNIFEVKEFKNVEIIYMTLTDDLEIQGQTSLKLTFNY